MNEDEHIIKFKCNVKLYGRINSYICRYELSLINDRHICISINYLILDIFSIINYNYIFDLSNMLYKLHTKRYYSGIQWNKGLI